MDANKFKESIPLETLQSFMHNAQLVSFLQKSADSYLSKEDFLCQSFPCGLDGETAWELIAFIRRIAGFPRLSDGPDESAQLSTADNYCTMPIATNQALYAIASRASSTSKLWHDTRLLQHRPQLIRPIVEDLHAACIRDGLGLGYEDVRQLVTGERPAESQREAIVVRCLQALSEAASAENAHSTKTMAEWHRQLVGDCVSLPAPYRHTNNPLDWLSPEPPDSPRDTIMFSEHYQAWGAHPLFSILMQAETFWVQEPLPSLNGLVEMVTRWQAVTHEQLPVMRLIPLSKLRLDWEQGIVNEATALFPFGKAVVKSSFGVDSTPYLLQMVRLIEMELDCLATKVDAMRNRDARQKAAIDQDCRLNHRQKELLAAMVDDPSLVVDVGQFAARFDVAISTARDDLNRLAALHFCLADYQGKKQVFWPNPHWNADYANISVVR